MGDLFSVRSQRTAFEPLRTFRHRVGNILRGDIFVNLKNGLIVDRK